MSLAKCLQLVVPASMTADDRAAWIAAAVDALRDIRPDEVEAVSAELRRSVTRPAQIVPEISKLVHERRVRRAPPPTPASETQAAEYEIGRQARQRLYDARDQIEIEEAQNWERQARRGAGLYVDPLPPPLTRAELDALPSDMIALGLKGGFLFYRDGLLTERTTP